MNPNGNCENEVPRHEESYLVPDNLRGVRGFVLEWVACRLVALILLAAAVLLTLKSDIPVVAALVFVVPAMYLWMTSFQIHAWRFGRSYRLWWGMSDSYSALECRVPVGEEPPADYKWSFRRDLETYVFMRRNSNL